MLQFQVSLKASQLSDRIDPETDDYLYKMTFREEVIYVPFPKFRFWAEDINEAKSFIESTEILELRILE